MMQIWIFTVWLFVPVLQFSLAGSFVVSSSDITALCLSWFTKTSLLYFLEIITHKIQRTAE